MLDPSQDNRGVALQVEEQNIATGTPLGISLARRTLAGLRWDR